LHTGRSSFRELRVLGGVWGGGGHTYARTQEKLV